MAHALSCYYLDASLSDMERELVGRVLLGPWARFKTGASSLVEKRVPNVLPLRERQGHFALPPEQRAELVRANLRHGGIVQDAGRQVLWIMPQDSEWDAVFQFAIRKETGFAPYVLQRWFLDQGRLIQRQARIIDTQRLIQGLELE